MSTGSYPDNDDFYLPTTSSAMNYPSMTIPGDAFDVPAMSSLDSFDMDFASEYLIEDAFSGTTSEDLTFVPAEYSGRGHAQDVMNSTFMPMDSPYMPASATSRFNPADIARHLTPPPEELLQNYFSSVQLYQDQQYSMDKDFTGYDSSSISHSSPDRLDSFHTLPPLPTNRLSVQHQPKDRKTPTCHSVGLGTQRCCD